MEYFDTERTFSYEKPELFAFVGDPMIVEGGLSKEGNISAGEDGKFDEIDGEDFGG